MKRKVERPLYHGGICLITDRTLCCLTPVEMAHLALKAGIRWIQYRDKDRDRRAFLATAMSLRGLTRQYGACFIVNDYPDIALIVDADGVHLGQDDMPMAEARRIMGRQKIIGISTHSLKDAVAANASGADYIGFGPVFATRTKDAGDPKGTEMLGRIVRKVDVPVVAIGGIRLSRLGDVMSAGACAVATASAILKGDVPVNARKYYNKINKLTLSAGS